MVYSLFTRYMKHIRSHYQVWIPIGANLDQFGTKQGRTECPPEPMDRPLNYIELQLLNPTTVMDYRNLLSGHRNVPPTQINHVESNTKLQVTSGASTKFH